MIGLATVAHAYSTLRHHYKEVSISGTLENYPYDSEDLVRFIAGYWSHKYEIHTGDFLSTEGLDAELIDIAPTTSGIMSIVIIHDRVDFNSPRLVQIALNTGPAGDANNGGLNECWRRFCRLKEACQATLFESISQAKTENYPITMNFSDLATLFSELNNEPFSLWDFSDPQYSNGLAVENAAELLTIGLLFPFEEAYDLQKAIVDAYGHAGLRSFNYNKIAKKYMIPERYVEVILTWDGLGGLIGDIGRSHYSEV